MILHGSLLSNVRIIASKLFYYYNAQSVKILTKTCNFFEINNTNYINYDYN